MLALATYLVTATAAAATASRTRRVSLPCFAALLVLPLAVAGPAMLGGGVFAPVDLAFSSEPLSGFRSDFGLSDEVRSTTRYDIAFRIIPWRAAARHAIEAGDWPLWNPFMFSGDVLAPSGEAGVYHPIRLLGYLLPLIDALNFEQAMFLFFALGSGFCFNRGLGCSEGASLFGGTAWMLSNFMTFWMGWPLALAWAGLPLVLASVDASVLRPTRSSAAALAVSIALVALAGHPQTTAHMAVVAALYSFGRLSGIGGSQRRLGAAVLATGGLTAGLLVAIDVLPFLEALGQSHELKARTAVWVPRSRGRPRSVASGCCWCRFSMAFLLTTSCRLQDWERPGHPTSEAQRYRSRCSDSHDAPGGGSDSSECSL